MKVNIILFILFFLGFSTTYKSYAKEFNYKKDSTLEILKIRIDDPWERSLQEWNIPLYINDKEIEYVISMIRDRLLLEGYYFSKVKVQIFLENEDIILGIKVFPGSGYLLGPSKTLRTETSGEVIDRLGLLKIGSVFNEATLKQAQEKLSRTGYFTDVEYPKLFKSQDRNQIYPLWNIQDIKGSWIKGVLGYESQQNIGLTGLLEINLKNMKGTARDLYFRFSSNAQDRISSGRGEGTNRAEREIHLEYKEPWIGPIPIGISGKVYFKNIDSVYEETILGIRLFQNISYHSHYGVSIAWDKNKTYKNIGDSIHTTSSHGYTTGFDMTYDWRNHIPYTTEGGVILGELAGIQRLRGNITDILVRKKITFSLWYLLWRYLETDTKWILYQRFSMGGIFPFSESLRNQGSLFELGGIQTIRGYREDFFRTNLYGYQNMEFRFIPSIKNYFFGFWDLAWVHSLKSSFTYNSSQWKYGYGLGVRLARGDWVTEITYALSPERSFQNALLHVSLENYF